MSDDHEALDWGQDGDERQSVADASGLNQNGGHISDGDDIEDTVSLGEEDDEPVYYTHHQVTTSTSVYYSGLHAEVPDRTPSSQRQDSLGANDQEEYPHNVMEVDSQEGSSSRNFRSSTRSPPRHGNSARHSSPPRSQPNGVRMTHALPPKPQASVLYRAPSHPSLVEAVGMASVSISPPNRTAMRDPKRTNGTSGKSDGSPMSMDLPPEWEKRYSRTGGQLYYYNRETKKTTWEIPVSNPPSTSYGVSQKRRRRSVSPPGNMHIVPPPDSNTHNSQSSRPKRSSSLPRHEDKLVDGPKSATPNPSGLSYEDRHYRPGGDPPSVSTEMPPPDRHEGMAIRNEPKSRYDRSPGMSPPHRRRGRSLSPLPDSQRPRIVANESEHYTFRGNTRPAARERNIHTNQEPPVPRSIDTTPVDPDNPDRRWARSPPPLPHPDFSRNDRGPRRPHRDEVDFVMVPRSDNRSRPDLRKRESSRGPRDREPPRPAERREKPNENPNYISVPTGYRSPPRNRDPDTGRDFPPAPRPLAAPAPEPVPHPASVSESRRERERPPPRYEYANNSGSSLPARPPPHPGRLRNDQPPVQFEQPRYRDDHDTDRNRRDPPPGNGNARPQNVYPEDPNRMVVDGPQRLENGYNQRPEESSLRSKRGPLPSQEKTFYRSLVPGHSHDPVPYAPGWANYDPTLPKEPRYAPNDIARNQQEAKEPMRQSDRSQPASSRPPPIDTRMNVDQQPNPQSASERISPYSRSRHPEPPREEPSRGRPEGPLPPPRQGPSNFGRPATSNVVNPSVDKLPPAPPPPQARQGDRQMQESRNMYPERNPPKESAPRTMHPERNPPAQPRRDNWSRSEDKGRPPPGSVSGTNNVPIGARRPPASVLPPNPNAHNGQPVPVQVALPPPPVFNPTARPPPSTLINPNKAFEQSSQKAHHDRPPHLPGGPSRSDVNLDLERPQHDKPQQNAEIQPPKPIVVSVPSEKPKRRRESRFSPIEQKQKLEAPHFSSHEWLARVVPPESVLSPTNDSEQQSMPPPPAMKDPPSKQSRFADRVPTPNVDNHRSAGPQIAITPSNNNSNNASYNSNSHKDIIPTSSSVQGPSTDKFSKLTQQRASNRPGIDTRQSSEQTSIIPPPHQVSQPDSSPTLARRMSSERERPPRLRKYPNTSPAITMSDNEFHGGAAQSSSSVNTVSEDLKDRLSERPTLLDRLQAPAPESDRQTPSLRDRLVPSKRDRDEVLMDERRSRDMSYDNEDGNDNKRVRRRAGKGRRGGGGGGRRNPS